MEMDAGHGMLAGDGIASASTDPIEALFKLGRLRTNLVLTPNQLCLMAALGIAPAPAKLVDIVLDPALRLGPPIPKAGPAGRVPGLTGARFPDQINVAAVYGIGVAANAPKEADAFVGFAMGPEGRRILDQYDFR